MRVTEAELGRFELPRWDAPYDVESDIDAAPADATVRGMFFDFVLDRVRKETGQSIDDQSRIAFGKYPMREYLKLLTRGASVLYPGVPLREGLRRLGFTTYNEFFETMIGRAIFSIAGRSFERVTTIAPKAYEVCYDPTFVDAKLIGPKNVRVVMAPMFVFPDTFHVGVWEGAARLYGHEAEVRVKRTRPGYVDYDVRWR